MQTFFPLLLAFAGFGYCIYLVTNTKPKKPQFAQEKEKYFEMMNLLGYDYYHTQDSFLEIKSFKELVNTNKKLYKATKKLRDDALRIGSDVFTR